MRILFDLNHPAHFHLFKNFIVYLKKNNHKIIITSRNKDILNELLQKQNWDFYSLSQPGKGILSKFPELISRNKRLINLAIKKNVDLCFGTSVSIAHLTIFTNIPSFNFNEDDDFIDPMYELLTYPFTTKIVNPKEINPKYFFQKRIFHNSLHELAYLHPNNFKPNPEVLKKYHLKKYKYIVIRKSALSATHDINARGLNKQILNKLIKTINDTKLEYVVSEETIHHQKIAISDMHHILAFAKLLISDSQTMTIEAAVLGVPSIRYNSFSKKSSVISMLENKFKLTVSLNPQTDKTKLFRLVNKFIFYDKLSYIYQKRKNKLLLEKEDLNKWMIEFFHKNLLKK